MVGRSGSERSLKSWKEIALFFGRDERTVKRWETQRGLPVHRIPGLTRASVYAYTSELEEWLTGHRDVAIPEPVDHGPTEQPRKQASRSRFRLVLAGVVVLSACAGAYGAITAMPELWSPQPPRAAKELLSDDIVATDLYLSGLYQIGLRTDDGLNGGIRMFTQAIARDPQFAAAFGGLSKAYNLLGQYTLMKPEEAYPLAEAAAERALKLDPYLASAVASLALSRFYWTRDFKGSRALFERALAFDPTSAETHHWFALTMMQTGDFDGALVEIDRAQALNPQARAILTNKAMILYHAGFLDRAVDILRQRIEDAPDYVAPHYYLADIYFDQGRYRESLEHSLEVARIQNSAAMRAIYQAAVAGFSRRGVTGLLEAKLSEQTRHQGEGSSTIYKIARTLAFLGRSDEALRELALAVNQREPETLTIKIDSAFRLLHGNPRFDELVVKAGYSADWREERAAFAQNAATSETVAPR